MVLTLDEVALRVHIALHLDHVKADDAFEQCVSLLFEDLIQSIAYDRCEDPGGACFLVAQIFCLNAPSRPQ